VEPIEGGVNDTVIYPSNFKEKTTPSFVNELAAINLINIDKEGFYMGKPPVLNFACPRNTDNRGKPFFYDNNSNLNLIEINGSKIPFVDAPLISTSELYTKTEAEREDDEESMRLVELETKTFVERENDDDDHELLELLTKTKVERESDDE